MIGKVMSFFNFGGKIPSYLVSIPGPACFVRRFSTPSLYQMNITEIFWLGKWWWHKWYKSVVFSWPCSYGRLRHQWLTRKKHSWKTLEDLIYYYSLIWVYNFAPLKKKIHYCYVYRTFVYILSTWSRASCVLDCQLVCNGIMQCLIK